MKTSMKVHEYRDHPAFDSDATVLVGRLFDVLHFGHLQFLKAAKAEGKILVVALEGDEYIQEHKKRKPIHTQEQRAEMLSELDSVDIVLKLPHMTTDEEYAELVKKVKPSVIAVTEGDTQMDNKLKFADSVGAKLIAVVPVIKDFSTTNILNHATISRD